MSGVFKFNKWLSLCIITALIVCGSFVVSYAGSDCPQGGEHDYTVTIVKRATENTDGVRKYVCSKCGDTYTEAIPATGHKWSSWVTDKKATWFQASKIFISSSGLDTMISAPAVTSIAWSLNPQSTMIPSISAFSAVAISTSESPM